MQTQPHFHRSRAQTPPEKASRCHHLPHLPPERGQATSGFLFVIREEKLRLQALTPHKEFGDPKLSAGVSSDTHHRSV